MQGTVYSVGSGESAKHRGLIAGRAGETLIVKTNDSTSTRCSYGLHQRPKAERLRLRTTQMSFTALIPGFRISVESIGDEQGRLVA